MKKLLAIVLALLTVLSLTSVVFAEGETTAAKTYPNTITANTGSITITNALEGTTYALYRAFDLIVVEDVETTTAPAETSAGETTSSAKTIVKKYSYVLDTTKGDDTAKANAVALAAAINANDSTAPFTLTEGLPGVYDVTLKEGADTTAITWLADYIDKLVAEGEAVTAISETVKFENLPLGYYVVVCPTTDDEGEDTIKANVSITSTDPDAKIIDKNDSNPKEVVKTAESYSGEVGGEVLFSTSFFATNFRVANQESARIMEYVLTDTAVDDRLAFQTEKVGEGTNEKDAIFGDADATINIYKNYDKETDTYSNPLSFGDEKGKYPEIDWKYEVVEDDDVEGQLNHVLTITWGDSETDDSTDPATVTTSSRYPANVWVVITYHMDVTTDIFDDDAIVPLENEIDVKMMVESSNKPEKVGDDTAEVYTTGVSITKVDANDTSKVLSGAQFILYKTVEETVSGEKKNVTYYWKWDSDNKKIDWQTAEKDAQVVTADNDDATVEFYGLKEGEYTIKEVKQPDGYALPKSAYTVNISKVTPAAEGEEKDAGQKFDVTIGSVAASYLEGGYYNVTIANSAGDDLPSTGGVGTTIFYVVGAILFIGAGILLITKKRMSGAN